MMESARGDKNFTYKNSRGITDRHKLKELVHGGRVIGTDKFKGQYEEFQQLGYVGVNISMILLTPGLYRRQIA